MVTVGQEFKNYKELCKYLGEDVKTGKSKELQLKRWQLSFSWHNKGYKIVIDDVKRDYIRQSSGGNRKHVDAFLPYVIYWLKMSGVDNDFIGTQRLIRSELKLISPEIYQVYNERSQDHSKYLAYHGITSYESLLKFVHYFEVCVNETVRGCLGIISKGGGVFWSPGQIFVIGMSHRRRVYTTSYEEVLDDVETAVCNEMNTERELKGRQYLHVIKRNPEMMEKFYKECITRLIGDKDLVAEIKDKYETQYEAEFIPEMIIKYYRLYYVEKIDPTVLRKWKLPDKIDNTRLKKAFVNPVGQEMQMLKKKVYEDIFQRMESKTNNKLGIPNNDFEKLKFLVMEYSPKLTNRNYRTETLKKQGGNLNGDIRTEAAEN